KRAIEIALLIICTDCNWREVKTLKYTLPRELEVCSGNYLKALWGVREMPFLFLVNSQIW
ncbi:MAG TPA: hypothetical protein PLH24_02950, partial [Candidatus Atribacteria bacterium]|nr:hypothetical protein [Candidatus Atribacteria bacterium]